MSENNQTPAAAEVKIIQLNVEITESFANFLKDYLEFFGSKMTIEDLAQQMIYEESSRLHVALTEYVAGNHYVGRIPWFKKFREVAVTTEGWDIEIEALPSEETSEVTEAAGGEKRER